MLRYFSKVSILERRAHAAASRTSILPVTVGGDQRRTVFLQAFDGGLDLSDHDVELVSLVVEEVGDGLLLSQCGETHDSILPTVSVFRLSWVPSFPRTLVRFA